MARRIVLFASLFFVALASGGAFVVYLLYNPATNPGPASWIGMLQLGTRVLIPLAAALNLGLLFTIISAVLARRDRPSCYLLVAASVCNVAAVLVTLVGNWPLNDQIVTWSLMAPPANWAEISHHWWRFHVVRAVLLVGTLCLVILATLLRRDAEVGRA
jgi:uncharacterized membrane protein